MRYKRKRVPELTSQVPEQQQDAVTVATLLQEKPIFSSSASQ